MISFLLFFVIFSACPYWGVLQLTAKERVKDAGPEIVKVLLIDDR